MPVVGVLWDVGNVIVRWDPANLYSKIFQEPAVRDRFLSSVCTLAWHLEHDRGVSFEDNRRPLIEKHPEHAEAITAWGERFIEMIDGLIPETVEAMHALAARAVPQFGLTNMPSAAWPNTTPLSPVFGYLKDTVVSGDEGLVKPDPAIFLMAAERAGLNPEQLLFIDDSPVNTGAAAALGFQVLTFTDPASLRPTLESHGLL
ncbi:MAG: superfamily hydrolase [Caulobacter sp.]|nr:superfamily hydrolase [Caulobacter sp.]